MNRRATTAAAVAMLALTTPAIAQADTRSIDPAKLEQLGQLSSLSSLGNFANPGSLNDLATALKERGKTNENKEADLKPAQPEMTDEQIAAHVIDLINDYRESQGVKRLNTDAELSTNAHQWAKTMKVNQNLSHPDKISFRENIAFNTAGADKAVEAWKASQGHNTNMLAEDVSVIGVGVVRGALSVTDEQGQTTNYGEGTFVVMRMR